MKNEEEIKDMIVSAHKRGACDSNGDSVKTKDGRFIAKPKSSSSATKRAIYEDGKLVRWE